MTIVIPVVLSGGSGTRLWPLSRTAYPKQFLALSGDRKNKTLFQEAVARLNQIHADSLLLGETIIVTNEDHRFLVLDQLREMDGVQATLLLEPAGRNTAPALTIASLYAKEAKTGEEIDPILVVTPADQTIKNGDVFRQALQNCITVVESDEIKRSLFWALLQRDLRPVMVTLRELIPKVALMNIQCCNLPKSPI